ncbi:uncharacterized protein BBA_07915 [Beauveria bassiana ARSEF 2860]|uniref:Uncharacterized protein n=1 Tax=Beauveria bassiana (strain ARSEF 2860) TaxID=655819 RepID=J4VXK8_BEAB2|nr:uncharacterized protein BBA_07915 [Beauveria bassiana ARSEF 2860]EJP63110.1 hypothetical protein BBA_07915 [Beauveria bassiana ARSEF 2860]
MENISSVFDAFVRLVEYDSRDDASARTTLAASSYRPWVCNAAGSCELADEAHPMGLCLGRLYDSAVSDLTAFAFVDRVAKLLPADPTRAPKGLAQLIESAALRSCYSSDSAHAAERIDRTVMNARTPNFAAASTALMHDCGSQSSANGLCVKDTAPLRASLWLAGKHVPPQSTAAFDTSMWSASWYMMVSGGVLTWDQCFTGMVVVIPGWMTETMNSPDTDSTHTPSFVEALTTAYGAIGRQEATSAIAGIALMETPQAARVRFRPTNSKGIAGPSQCLPDDYARSRWVDGMMLSACKFVDVCKPASFAPNVCDDPILASAVELGYYYDDVCDSIHDLHHGETHNYVILARAAGSSYTFTQHAKACMDITDRACISGLSKPAACWALANCVYFATWTRYRCVHRASQLRLAAPDNGCSILASVRDALLTDLPSYHDNSDAWLSRVLHTPSVRAGVQEPNFGSGLESYYARLAARFGCSSTSEISKAIQTMGADNVIEGLLIGPRAVLRLAEAVGLPSLRNILGRVDRGYGQVHRLLQRFASLLELVEQAKCSDSAVLELAYSAPIMQREAEKLRPGLGVAFAGIASAMIELHTGSYYLVLAAYADGILTSATD